MATRLSKDEQALVSSLMLSLSKKRRQWKDLSDAYSGTRQVEMIGMALPEDMRGFEFPLNWARVTVDAVESRQEVKSLIRPGLEGDDPAMREAWEMNDMPAQSSLLHLESLVQGRGFVTVGVNADDPQHPAISVESSRAMVARVDPRSRRLDAAFRFYSDPDTLGGEYASLYRPNETTHLARAVGGSWEVERRDPHNLGRVPVVMHLNRNLAGEWFGQSEMADVLGPMDMATRTLMNLQMAMEIAAIPRRYAINATRDSFVGADGKQRSSWDAAMDAIWAVMSKPGQEVKLGQFDAVDPSGFVRVVTMLAEQCSSITGLPVRYFGQNTVNPAAEGAIRADEWRLVKNVERKNRALGDTWGDVLSLYERLRTGEWIPQAERISVEWQDPATPTYAQRADAIQKLSGGTPVLSRQGAWDEMGWSTARKERELRYFEQELTDPVLSKLIAAETDAAGGW